MRGGRCVGFFLFLVVVSCDGGVGEEVLPTGALTFTMNGEGFARDGFVSEDGWRVDFEHVYASIADLTAYQVVEETETEAGALRDFLAAHPTAFHAGHPHAEIPEGAARVDLPGAFVRDLHQGPDPIPIGAVSDAPIGNYNRLSFDLVPAEAAADGFVDDLAGASLVFVGTARQDDRSVSFTLRFDASFGFEACGPHHDDLGVVAEGGEGQAELTFHFDHVFGDADEGPADSVDPEAVNAVAIGFGPFLALAEGDVIDAGPADLAALPEHEALMEALATVGHSGEGHCHLRE
jgi:hypothetical protein